MNSRSLFTYLQIRNCYVLQSTLFGLRYILLGGWSNFVIYFLDKKGIIVAKKLIIPSKFGAVFAEKHRVTLSALPSNNIGPLCVILVWVDLSSYWMLRRLVLCHKDQDSSPVIRWSSHRLKFSNHRLIN